MEQEIRFCTSADGTRIAYTYRGEGPPLLCITTWSVVSIERGFPAEAMAHGRRVVLFDHRGTGSPERDVEEISVEAQALDLAAVADELQLDHFDLWGDYDSSPVAITYAANHPERISRLILSGCYSHGGEISPQESIRSLAELARDNWAVARRTLADITFPQGPLEAQRQYADMMRENSSSDVAARYLELFNDVDVRPLLPRVNAPTLVLHPRGEFRSSASAIRAVAAQIPNARLATPDGPPIYPNLAKVAGQFLDEERDEVDEKDVRLPEGTAIILFLDIAGSTALTSKLGDAAYRERARIGHFAAGRDHGGWRYAGGGQGAGRWNHERFHVSAAGDRSGTAPSRPGERGRTAALPRHPRRRRCARRQQRPRRRDPGGVAGRGSGRARRDPRIGHGARPGTDVGGRSVRGSRRVLKANAPLPKVGVSCRVENLTHTLAGLLQLPWRWMPCSGACRSRRQQRCDGR